MSTTMIVINAISAALLLYWIFSDIHKQKKMLKAKQEQEAKLIQTSAEAPEDPQGQEGEC